MTSSSEFNLEALVREQFGRDIRLARTALTETQERSEESILAGCLAIASTLASGHRLLICGNGGSAADSQHIAAELVSSFGIGLKRRALSAIALTTDSSILTAYSNDFGFDEVFARQVEAHGTAGDCLLAISTSGNSVNVNEAVRVAKRLGMLSVALTGANDSLLSRSADICIQVQSTNTQIVQTVHLVVEHLICFSAEQLAIHTEPSE